ncbi:M23 family metallopeptidase [Aeromicrobium sp. UC242_57]|uniref:M23 family metallopeptidase n=1 Tax=Aeromicrobium sp. UC242_57 TaxID=3374624 RepID=UPI0037A088EB
MTARFGQSSGLWSTTHTGLDFAGPAGTTIVSVAAGTVTSSGYEGAYGNRTIITLNDGTEIWYCHQSKIVANVGDVVAPGQVIGYTGSTGNVTGPHLHLEVRPGGGDPIDPYAALSSHDARP